jgi:uncharacterized membrane protein YwzB
MKLLRHPFVLVLFVVTFVDSLVHTCYFNWTASFLKSPQVGIPANWVMPVMTIGQIAEIGTMAFLGFCLKKMGWRTTMVIGILGHALRFAVFAWAPHAKELGLPWMVPTLAAFINVVHGICYAFFFATVYIFVDEFFPKDARSSAQGLFNFLILGLGPFVGNFLWASLGNSKMFETAVIDEATGKWVKTVDFEGFFLVPAAVALLAALFLFLFFRPPERAAASLPADLDGGPSGDAAWTPGGASEGIHDPQRRHGISGGRAPGEQQDRQ